MSIESAKAFANRVSRDPALKARLAAAATEQARLDIAKAEGYDFTREDMLQIRGELSDAELDAVVGADGYDTLGNP